MSQKCLKDDSQSEVPEKEKYGGDNLGLDATKPVFGVSD